VERNGERRAPGVISSLWRFRWSSLAVVLTLTLLSTAAGLLLAPPPAARATITLKNPGSENLLARGVVGDASLARYTRQRADYITSDSVLEQVAGTLRQYDVTTLRRNIKVATSPTSNQFTVTASAGTAAEAVTLANTVVEAYRRATAAQVKRLTDDALDSIQKARSDIVDSRGAKAFPDSAIQTLSNLEQRASALRTDSAVFNDGVDFVQQASLDQAVVARLPFRNIAAGGIFGLLLAALLAWVRADRNRQIEREEDLEPVLGAPLLAAVVVGRKHEPAVGTAPQYRLLGIDLAQRSHGLVAVMSAGHGPERAEVAYNLAVALASDARRVLVVDADPSARLSNWLWNGTPAWLKPFAEVDQARKRDAEHARAVARHGTLRGSGPDPAAATPTTVAQAALAAPVPAQPATRPATGTAAAAPAVPADQPDSAAGGMGFVARLVREKHPDATPLALPVLDGVVAKSSGNGSGAANGAGGSNGSPSSSTGSANGSSNGSANGSANGASSGSASASGNGAGDDLTGAAAPRRPDGQDDGTEIRRVNLPDDASVDLVTLRDGRARSARDVVASLGAMAARYDVVLVDLPAVDTSALAPALLQGAGEVLAVVARGSAEHAVDELRRTTRIFSTPIRGCIFTQTHR
jgi:capsular polysaccharide biosynthesis protein